MLVRQKSTGLYLDARGKFRKPMTASQRCHQMSNPDCAGLVNTIQNLLPKVCEKFRIESSTVELVNNRNAF